jgi:hypothetical protein
MTAHTPHHFLHELKRVAGGSRRVLELVGEEAGRTFSRNSLSVWARRGIPFHLHLAFLRVATRLGVPADPKGWRP